MEADNLGTASLYINNLLLSRGLLRNGQAIDFAHPHRDEGGLEPTMGRIMRVINDLILRRDRDAEQRENLSQTIRTLKSDTLRQTTDFERLQTKYLEAQRRLGLAEAAERAFKLQIKSAEQAARVLKEEMGRMRILVGQTRAQCANEVRKRERVIEGLKKHVGEGGRARGSGKAVGVAIINVTAGVGAEEGVGRTVGTEDSGYDLRMETNEFLTDLARGLSEENENLGGLVRRTVDSLATISGWQRESKQDGSMVLQTDASFDNLAADIDTVIEHLRKLLTNPSFVPLEEVEVREEEIYRLREGWERMEGRWREAVQMMDGWRRRMAKSGQTVNLEELRMGLRLSPVRVPGVSDVNDNHEQVVENEGEGDTQADIDAMNDSQVPRGTEQPPELEDESDTDSLYEESPPHEEDLEEEHEVSIHTVSSVSPGPPPQISPLKDSKSASNRRSNFTTIIEENTWDLANLDYSSSNIEGSIPADDGVQLLKVSGSQTPRKVSSSSIKSMNVSRLPRPASAMAQQSPLTMASIAAKLAATEREADAARVRAKLKAAKLSAAGIPTLKPPTTMEEKREPSKMDPAQPSPSKKRKATGKAPGGRTSRRRSTLSPWELESLILGAVGATPVKASG